MNWFTWILVIVGVLVALGLLVPMVRAKRGSVDEEARRRERDMGESFYRGGLHGRPWDGNTRGP